MAEAIKMRELQKMSASTINALTGPTPIRNGNRTVAILVPLRNTPDEAFEQAVLKIEAAREARTPEEQAELDAFLRSIGEP